MKIIILLSAVLFSSCISAKYTPTNQFDFKQAKHSEFYISVGKIITEGPYSEKIVNRQGYYLSEDEFNRWCESPEDMFTRHWKISFTNNTNNFFDGVIRRFDFDLDHSEAHIIFDLVYQDKTSRITAKEKFSDSSIKSKVDAMNSAFQKLTEELKKKL